MLKKVRIIQEKDHLEKKLSVGLYGEAIHVYDDHFVEQTEFRIFTNYAPVIGHWRFEISDDDTNKVVKVFEGNRFNIYDPIFWDGRG